jgi:hypothetical protein
MSLTLLSMMPLCVVLGWEGLARMGETPNQTLSVHCAMLASEPHHPVDAPLRS